MRGNFDFDPDFDRRTNQMKLIILTEIIDSFRGYFLQHQHGLIFSKFDFSASAKIPFPKRNIVAQRGGATVNEEGVDRTWCRTHSVFHEPTSIQIVV